MSTISKNYDVIIVGGSFAGLSAALSLVRLQRQVLVIDSENPCNKLSEYSHNFLSRDGERPAEILAKSKAQLKEYSTIDFLNTEVISASSTKTNVTVEIIGGKSYHAKKLLFATGIRDVMPGIAGFAECWGNTILHCPYCHGYEKKDKKMAVVANGEHAYHLCLLLASLSDDIILFTNGPSELSAEQEKTISKKNIKIINTVIQKIEHSGGQIKEIILVDGKTHDCTVMFAKVLLKQACELPEKMGCEFNDHLIKVDECQKTSLSHVYAAGDNCRLPRTISLAVGAGTQAAFMLNWELTTEFAAV